MCTSPTDALGYDNLEAERVLFLLAFADLDDDTLLIDGGPRLEVFETFAAISRASDLMRAQ